MDVFWEIVASNSLVVVGLAVGVALLGRLWKNPNLLHLLWVFVLLKFVTPPLITIRVPLPAHSPPPAAERQGARQLIIDPSSSEPSREAKVATLTATDVDQRLPRTHVVSDSLASPTGVTRTADALTGDLGSPY